MTRTDLEQHIKELEVKIDQTRAAYEARKQIKDHNIDMFVLSMKLDYALMAISSDSELVVLNRKLISLKKDLDTSRRALQLMHRVPDFFYGEGDICMMEELTKNGYLKGIKF